MHILYVDDSGDVGNASDAYFVLGGISVFERGIYHLIKATDEIVASFGLADNPHDIELHGSPMSSGRGSLWRSIERNGRERMIHQALQVLGRNASVRLFAVAVNRAAVSPRDPVELAFEELCNRFNLFLNRINNRQVESQRGLLVMDNMKHEPPLQALARHFRLHGGRWGHFRNLAEVPLFVDSKASRLIQLADLVAFATWRRYEHQNGRFFEPLIPTRVEADTPRKAGGFAPSTPVVRSTHSREGVPPGSQALRGTRPLCRAALETPAARRSGVQGVKPPAFFEESNSTRVGIIPHFDTEGGVIHGLVHHRRIASGVCYCPACASRLQRTLPLPSRSVAQPTLYPYEEDQPPSSRAPPRPSQS